MNFKKIADTSFKVKYQYWNIKIYLIKIVSKNTAQDDELWLWQEN